MNHSQKFSPQQLQLILSNKQSNKDLNQLAAHICQKIKIELRIDRSVNDVRQFLIQNTHQSKNNELRHDMKQANPITSNLFKSFEDGNRSSEGSLLNLARPVPKRKVPAPFFSKRKIPKRQLQAQRSQWTLQQRLDQIQQINQDCTYSYDKYDRKINKKASIKQQQQGAINSNIQWFYNQYFYSNYDKRYFECLSASQMRQIYNHLGLKPGQPHLTLKTHKNILKCLPKVRLFNQQFILNERNKLEQFRNSCRQNTKNLVKSSNQSTTDFPVHSFVLALHPLCGHLHIGSIMAYYKQNLYMVRFLKPQLPAHKILDINMSTQFTILSNNQSSNRIANRSDLSFDKQKSQIISNNSNMVNNSGNTGQNIQYQILENVNFEATGYLIKLLAFKSDLIRAMTIINDRTDKKENVAPDRQETINFINSPAMNINKSRQMFQWVVNIIKKLDIVINQILVRFRLRGVNETNSAAIFGNLRNLLINPLKLMSKQFENSNEQSDLNAAQQIREIINKQRQNQIKKALNSVMQQNAMKDQEQQLKNEYSMENQQNNDNENVSNQQLVNKNIGSQKERKILQPGTIQLLQSCLGVLADLKYEGKEFDCQKNLNLVKLAQISGKENSQAFNQIYQRLYSIVAKVKQ